MLCCRYHSTKTLRLMNKYRIGRIDGPWLNFTPPIRGGLYRDRRDEANESASSDDDELHSTFSTSNSSTTSVDSVESLSIVKPTGDSLRVASVRKGHPIHRLGHAVTTQQSKPRSAYFESEVNNVSHEDTVSRQYQTPAEYGASAVQRAIDKDVEEYPSLDAETQQKITMKYQALHQRVKDENFYVCRYGEYGKELVRYAVLFSLFLVALRAEWYITSAAFLGFFWVSLL